MGGYPLEKKLLIRLAMILRHLVNDIDSGASKSKMFTTKGSIKSHPFPNANPLKH